jgi:hypothetical protein
MMLADEAERNGNKFPENRENNREFYKFELLQKDITSSPENENTQNHYRAILGFVNFRLF